MSQENRLSADRVIRVFRNAQLWTAVAVILLLSISFALPLTGHFDVPHWLSWFYFINQDLLFLIPLLGVLLVRPSKIDIHPVTNWGAYFVRPTGVVSLAIVLMAVCWAGHYFIMLAYDLSRDEQMANFDAYIFLHGRIFWPIAEGWRPFAEALNRSFIEPVGNYEGWVSGYLPINAAMRAGVGFIADPAITDPLLVAVGALALWRVALRLWPNSPPTQFVVLLLYAGSSQIVVTGMTPYAMTGHLALNLVWLALFLRDRKFSHLGALAIGFLATGLHQPFVHPLFVIPFALPLVLQRRWKLLAFYCAGYALICAFWFAWPIWVESYLPGVPQSSDDLDYLTRLLNRFERPDLNYLWLMALNLLRFVTWQHLLLLPLSAIGLRFAWKNDDVAKALAISLVLPIALRLILLPYQGHGWGYRYLHGDIGYACLLGGYGWNALESNGLSLRRVFVWASAATFVLFIPLHAVIASRMVKSLSEPSRVIDRTDADIVIVEHGAAPFTNDMVINMPDLSNRPIRLLETELRPGEISQLCSLGSVAFLETRWSNPVYDYMGWQRRATSDSMIALETAARKAGCRIMPVNAGSPAP